MKKLLLTILLCLAITGCVLINGRDKDRLSEGTVLANSHYLIAQEKIANGEKIPDEVLLHWLDTHRKLFAMIVGANEGKTSAEVLEKLNKSEVLMRWEWKNGEWFALSERDSP